MRAFTAVFCVFVLGILAVAAIVVCATVRASQAEDIVPWFGVAATPVYVAVPADVAPRGVGAHEPRRRVSAEGQRRFANGQGPDRSRRGAEQETFEEPVGAG